MIKVYLVDDQTLVRQGIRSLLELSDQVAVIGEAASGQQALTELKDNEPANAPQVILMDIRMPGLSGIDTLTELRDAGVNVPVMMLTTFDDHESVMAALHQGASGYVLKDVALETLVEAITCVANGERWIQPAVTERMLQGLSQIQPAFASAEQPEPLSDKELAVLRLMASGLSNREIASALFKSEGTVKNQVSTIMAKLGVRDRTRAVLKALETGWI
ncbi:response regulator [Pseudidiomarina terrestris]|uniref:Response regulator transcription factor n=1 Tax=Pseudidiomarina terrestris TaxID=2820060 RepID=A0AAW7R2D0_9GAMM|nr:MULTISPECIES: response regulator transcription factor [unclassified Pseudidiomarina]MDN7125468.1 response regulator transcription factor [Pseudidiomarina sp. 1APP75-32.1]MDN7128101.1 response regulator transcription factor [Pseudidiomarina sp. 1APR75-33.1]MDN7130226.1 response regulator transcription factor [Pseudidiomarina sp. 1APR75-15]MDN7135735.1 response regulator transcription factor [Pseudidiomarina sp. 1ASP75-5]MDN7137228.1 response regulator transcription factor [Pseudidiomarina sp